MATIINQQDEKEWCSHFALSYKNIKGSLCKHIYYTWAFLLHSKYALYHQFSLAVFSTIKDVRKSNIAFVVYRSISFNHDVYSTNMHLWFEKNFRCLFSFQTSLLKICRATLTYQQKENKCVLSFKVLFWIMYLNLKSMLILTFSEPLV